MQLQDTVNVNFLLNVHTLSFNLNFHPTSTPPEKRKITKQKTKNFCAFLSNIPKKISQSQSQMNFLISELSFSLLTSITWNYLWRVKNSSWIRFRTGNLLFWSLKVAFSLILPPTKRSCFLCLQEQILPHHDRFTFNLSVDLHIRQ